MPDQQHLAYAVARWLRESNKEAAAKEVEKAFDVNVSAQAAKFGTGPGLAQIFDVFLKTQSKVSGGAAPAAAAASSAPPAAAASKKPSAEDAAQAEKLKTQGNKAMSSKDFAGAIEAYTRAIELAPSNPVYYSNRSAAFAQTGQHEEAIADAREAARVDPTFAKAYSRLGHGLFSSGRFAEAAEAYAKGLELDPSNGPMKSGLETAKKHAKEHEAAPEGEGDELESTRGAPGAGAGAPGGMPDLSALAGLMGGMGGGGGGMPDLAGLMRNPAIMQMAQNMMQNGGLEQLMNNPMLRGMMGGGGAGGAGGGGGGMPDINAMMQDPAMREMARNMMGGGGGAGGAPGAGAGAGGAGAAGRRGNGNAGGSNGDDMFS